MTQNEMSLYEIINSLQNAQGSTAKLAILEANKDNELLKEYMKATYDPSISYYQSKIPKHGIPSGRQACFDLVDIKHAKYIFAERRLTGTEAIKAMKNWLEDQNSVEDQYLIELLIKRSIGAGVGETMVLKVWPELFFIPPYMRCSLMDSKTKEKFNKLPYFYCQTKMDGAFAYLSVGTNTSELITRNGNKYPAEIARQLSDHRLNGFVLSGELTIEDMFGNILSRQEGNGILNSLMQGGELPEGMAVWYTAWDVVTQDEFEQGFCKTDYKDRLYKLYEITIDCESFVQVVYNKRVDSLAEAYQMYSQHTKLGLEGVIIKNPHSLWKDGTSKDMVKLKIEFSAEYIITGIYEGEGKYKGMLGGFHIESSCGKIKNSVGTGLNDQQRKDYFTQDMIGKIIEVKANDVISKEGSDTMSLFLPVAIEIRNDKTEADSFEHIMKSLQAAKDGV